MYNIIDLKSCYDRQLLNIEGTVKESVGRNRQAMKLFIIIMPYFQYYACTYFRISSSFYSGFNKELAGTQ